MGPMEQEMAKAAGQILVDTAKDSRKAIGVVLGDAAREFGLTLGDHAKFFRFKNLTNIMEKVEAIRREKGLTPEQMKALPFGDAHRVIEAASMEEEDDVQRLWARLIANASSTASDVTIRKPYIDILKSVSPIEAVFLDLMHQFQADSFSSLAELDAYNEAANAEVERRWRRFPEADRHSAIQNLIRLRCVSLRPQPLSGDRLLARAPREIVDSSFDEWSFVSARNFERFMRQLLDQLAVIGGSKDHVPTKGVELQTTGWTYRREGYAINAPELNYVLTALGKELMQACSLEDADPPSDA